MSLIAKLGLNRQRLVLHTALSIDECRRRLEDRTYRGWFWFLQPQEPVQGKVSETGFALRRSGRTPRQLPIEAKGTFAAREDGAEIRVELGRNRSLLSLAAVAAAILLVGFALVGVSEGIGSGPLFALLVAAIGLAVAVLTLWVCAGDAAYLIRFLRETLEAQEVA